jgi:WD40 repeat protein
VNHVAWCPSDENELITASFDNVIKVWDLKKMDKPRLELRGHARFGNDFRGKTIYHPMYHSNGRFIVTPGEKSGGLSIFDTSSGLLTSRVVITVGEVTSISSCDIYGSRLAASRGSKIVLLDSVWNA